MSMLAKFVQITPDRLREIIDEPELVPSLFGSEPEKAMATMLQLSERVHKRMQGMAPAMLENAMARLDPAIREALTKRLQSLGITPESIASGAGVTPLLQRMADAAKAAKSAGFARSTDDRGAGTAGGGAPMLSLDKAWHGVHFLLSGAGEPGAALISQAIMGGTEVGDDDSGYGPARYFDSAQVAAIATELGRANLEAEMKSRYDAARMTSLGIYPGGWTPQELDWLMEEFAHLRDFFASAHAAGAAIVTCLV